MKSKATGCGSISTVFCSIVLLCVSIKIITIINDHNSNNDVIIKSIKNAKSKMLKPELSW